MLSLLGAVGLACAAELDPHYDGAKDQEAVIQVWGIGPVKTTAATEP